MQEQGDLQPRQVERAISNRAARSQKKRKTKDEGGDLADSLREQRSGGKQLKTLTSGNKTRKELEIAKPRG